MTKCDLWVFIAQVLFSLGLIKAWEIEYALGIPIGVHKTWFWQDEKETTKFSPFGN